jgi:hypothetical protein
MSSNPYQFHKRNDGSYRCESRVPGEGACLVRRRPTDRAVWETATVPVGPEAPRFTACPVGEASFTRLGAVMARFYFHRA